MENPKIAKARQLKKNEALNAIRKIYNPKYKFPYDDGIDDCSPSSEAQREKAISNIIDNLERDLSNLKITNL